MEMTVVPPSCEKNKVKVRIDVGEVHGFIDGRFIPDDGATVYIGPFTSTQALADDLQNALD